MFCTLFEEFIACRVNYNIENVLVMWQKGSILLPMICRTLKNKIGVSDTSGKTRLLPIYTQYYKSVLLFKGIYKMRCIMLYIAKISSYTYHLTKIGYFVYEIKTNA